MYRDVKFMPPHGLTQDYHSWLQSREHKLDTKQFTCTYTEIRRITLPNKKPSRLFRAPLHLNELMLVGWDTPQRKWM